MGSVTIDEGQEGSVEIVERVEDARIDEQAGVQATSALNRVARGEKAIVAYQEAVKNRDYPGALTAWRDAVGRNRINDIQATVGQQPTNDVASNITQLNSNLTGANGVPGVDEESVKTNPGILRASPEGVIEEKWATAYRNSQTKYATQFKDESLLEKIRSVAGTALPFRDNVDLFNLLTASGYDVNPIDVSFFSASTITRFRNFFNEQSPEVKLFMFKSINNQMDLESDNPLVRADQIRNLFGPTFNQIEERAENVIDTLAVPFDVAAIVKGSVSIGSRLADTNIPAFGRATDNFVKKSNIINTGQRTNDPELTARLIQGASDDVEGAAKVGIKPAHVVDAMDITLPNSALDLLTGADKSVASAVQHILNLQRERIQELLDTTDREGLLTDQDMLDLAERVKMKFEKKDNIADNTFQIQVINETDYKIKYDRVNMDEEGNVIGIEPVEINANFVIEDVRGLVDADKDWVPAFVRRDPNARAVGQTKRHFVTNMERITPQQDRFTSVLKELFEDAYKGQGLNAADEAMVDKVLTIGSKAGEEYDFFTLVNVGVGANQTILTEKQAKGYIAHRNAMDLMAHLQTQLVAENLTIQGVKIAELPGEAVNVKPFDDVDSAVGAFKKQANMKKDDRGSAYITVYGDDFADWTSDGLITSDFKAWTKADWERVYDKDYVLARNHNPQQFFRTGNQKTQWALVKRNTLNNPIGMPVINIIKGYMPIDRKQARFWIQQTKVGELTGARDFETKHMVAYGDNIRDVEAWVARQEGEYKILLDRELSDTRSLYANSSISGGMYRGKRKSTPLEYVGKSGNDTYADSMEGVQGYINQLGKRYPISFIREGAQARAIATAKNLGVEAKGLDGLVQHESRARATPEVRGVLHDIHSQVSFLRDVPTQAERDWSMKVTKVAKVLDRKLGGKIDRADKMIDGVYAYGSDGTQISDVIRGVTFRVMLGMYNPAQLFVQGSAIALSLSISPQHALPALRSALVWRTMEYAKTPAERRDMIKWHTENGYQEEAESFQMWDRSGLRQSIRNSNASYEGALTSKGPYDEGYIRKFLSNDTIFYQMGESANTRVAYAVAYHWAKAQKGVTGFRPTDKMARDFILERTELNRMNMSRANQSDMNKGAKSVPLQFQQVIDKYAVKILPQWMGGTKELTWQEKMGLFGIPTVLFGAAAVPGFSYVVNQIMEESGIDPSEVPEEVAVAATDGAAGLIYNNILGFENDFSGRFSLAVNPFELFTELWTQGGGWWNMGGPAVSVAKRTWRDMQYVGQAFSVVWNDETNSTTPENLLLVAEAIKDAIVNVATVTRNLDQYGAHVFGDNPSLVKAGITITRDLDLNTQSALAAIFGFQPKKPQDLYAMKANQKKLKGGIKGAPKFGLTEAELVVRLLERGLTDDNERSRQVHMNAVQTIMGNYNIEDRRKLQKQARSLILDEKLRTGEIIRKVMRQQYENMEKGVSIHEDLRMSGTLSREASKRNK